MTTYFLIGEMNSEGNLQKVPKIITSLPTITIKDETKETLL
jgi:hypothetical protein